MRTTLTLVSLALLAGGATSRAGAQDPIPEITSLRQHIAAIRQHMPEITRAAEYTADVFARDSGYRFLVPRAYDPAMRLEMYWHAGGPPETGDADDAALRGIVVMPVRTWAASALSVAAMIERWQGMGRPVVVIGPAAGKPPFPLGQYLVDDGAVAATDDPVDRFGLANVVAVWTYYAEFVAAATRQGWRPGTYLSSLVEFNQRHNNTVRFRMPDDGTPVPRIPAGQLGNAYLDAVEAGLTAAATPAHQLIVQRAADSLRAWRDRGSTLFVASCGHYLQEEVLRDSTGTPFHPFDWRWDPAEKLKERGAQRGDAMLWFGHGGYDCPSAEVAPAFSAAGLHVVPVSDHLPVPLPANAATAVPLVWKLPDAGAPIPFPPGAVSPTSSVDGMVHWLWLMRLVGHP